MERYVRVVLFILFFFLFFWLCVGWCAVLVVPEPPRESHTASAHASFHSSRSVSFWTCLTLSVLFSLLSPCSIVYQHRGGSRDPEPQVEPRSPPRMSRPAAPAIDAVAPLPYPPPPDPLGLIDMPTQTKEQRPPRPTALLWVWGQPVFVLDVIGRERAEAPTVYCVRHMIRSR